MARCTISPKITTAGGAAPAGSGAPPRAKSRVSFNATQGKRNHLRSTKAAIGGFVRDSDGRGVPAGGD